MSADQLASGLRTLSEGIAHPYLGAQVEQREEEHGQGKGTEGLRGQQPGKDQVGQEADSVHHLIHRHLEPSQ